MFNCGIYRVNQNNAYTHHEKKVRLSICFICISVDYLLLSFDQMATAM